MPESPIEPPSIAPSTNCRRPCSSFQARCTDVPKFTYLWTLAISRFPDALRRRISRSVALREIARCFLAGAGATIPGELARVTGLSRPEAGLGNRALVKEGFAVMTGPGHYRLAGSR